MPLVINKHGEFHIIPAVFEPLSKSKKPLLNKAELRDRFKEIKVPKHKFDLTIEAQNHSFHVINEKILGIEPSYTMYEESMPSKTELPVIYIAFNNPQSIDQFKKKNIIDTVILEKTDFWTLINLSQLRTTNDTEWTQVQIENIIAVLKINISPGATLSSLSRLITKYGHEWNMSYAKYDSMKFKKELDNPRSDINKTKVLELKFSKESGLTGALKKLDDIIELLFEAPSEDQHNIAELKKQLSVALTDIYQEKVSSKKQTKHHFQIPDNLIATHPIDLKLAHAVYDGDLALIKELLYNGANPNVCHHSTPLILILLGYWFNHKKHHDNLHEALKLFMSYDCNPSPKYYGQTAVGFLCSKVKGFYINIKDVLNALELMKIIYLTDVLPSVYFSEDSVHPFAMWLQEKDQQIIARKSKLPVTTIKQISEVQMLAECTEEVVLVLNRHDGSESDLIVKSLCLKYFGEQYSDDKKEMFSIFNKYFKIRDSKTIEEDIEKKQLYFNELINNHKSCINILYIDNKVVGYVLWELMILNAKPYLYTILCLIDKETSNKYPGVARVVIFRNYEAINRIFGDQALVIFYESITPDFFHAISHCFTSCNNNAPYLLICHGLKNYLDSNGLEYIDGKPYVPDEICSIDKPRHTGLVNNESLVPTNGMAPVVIFESPTADEIRISTCRAISHDDFEQTVNSTKEALLRKILPKEVLPSKQIKQATNQPLLHIHKSNKLFANKEYYSPINNKLFANKKVYYR